MKKRKLLITALLVVSLIPTLHAKSPALEELDQRQKVLERKLELLEEGNKDKGGVSAGKEGFSLKSKDDKFKLKFKGLVQLDGRFYLDTPAHRNQGNDTFIARRVRPTLEGTLWGFVDFKIMPDFGGGNVVLQDAYTDIRFFEEFALQAGKFREPVGLERLTSASNLLFIERGLPTNLVPNRDLGVAVHGNIGKGILEYALGVFNGVADGSSADIDAFDGKDIAARVFVKPFAHSSNDWVKGIGVGLAATYGTQEGTSAAPNLPTYRSGGQLSVFRYRTDAATPANTARAQGNIFRLTPQLRADIGPVTVLGEYVRSSQEVGTGAAQDTLVHQAWQGAVAVILTGEKASPKGVSPLKPFSIKEGQWGAVDVVARVNQLDLDDDSFPTFANPASSVTKATGIGGGVNWYLNNNLKIALNYEHTLFKGGSAPGTNRSPEKAFLTRVQVAF